MRPAVFFCDREGYVRQASGGRNGHAGWPVEHFVNRHVLEIVVAEDCEALASVFAQAESRPDFTVAYPIPFVLRIESPSGSIISADAVATGQLAGDDPGWIVVLHPHDNQTTPVAPLLSLMDGRPVGETLDLAADHLTGSGTDSRRIGGIIVTDVAGGATHDHNRFGSALDGEVSDAIVAAFEGQGSTLRTSGVSPIRHGCETLPAPLQAAMLRHGFEELVVAPISTGVGDGATLLVVNGPTRNPMPDNVCQIIDRVTKVAGLAIRSDGERRQLVHAANHDPLTGLANRRRLGERLEELRFSELAVVFVDLDSFKAVNDQYGHPVGDAVIVAVAARLAAACGLRDLACRVGGDEFVLVFAGSDADEAHRRTEGLKAQVASSLGLAVGPERVTVSVGVAAVAADDPTDRDVLLVRSNQAMREDKPGQR